MIFVILKNEKLNWGKERKRRGGKNSDLGKKK